MSEKKRRLSDTVIAYPNETKKPSSRWPIVLFLLCIIMSCLLAYGLFFGSQIKDAYTQYVYQPEISDHPIQSSDTQINTLSLVALSNVNRGGHTVEDAVWASLIQRNDHSGMVHELNMPLNIKTDNETPINNYSELGLSGIEQSMNLWFEQSNNYIVAVRLNRLRPLVDALGPIEVVSSRKVDYRDIHLEAGESFTFTPVIMSDILESVVSYGDLDLLYLQHLIVMGLFDTFLDQGQWLKWPSLIETMKDAVV